MDAEIKDAKNQRSPCTGTMQVSILSKMQRSTKVFKTVYPYPFHISIFSLNDQTVCSSTGEMELA